MDFCSYLNIGAILRHVEHYEANVRHIEAELDQKAVKCKISPSRRNVGSPCCDANMHSCCHLRAMTSQCGRDFKPKTVPARHDMVSRRRDVAAA